MPTVEIARENEDAEHAERQDQGGEDDSKLLERQGRRLRENDSRKENEDHRKTREIRSQVGEEEEEELAGRTKPSEGEGGESGGEDPGRTEEVEWERRRRVLQKDDDA